MVAPLDLRIAYVMRREGLDQAAARTRIQTKDRERIRYLQEEHRQHPEDPHLYDLVVNTGILGLDSVVNLISLALELKARRLSTPTGELGPATGLARYPASPDDFRPTKSTGPLEVQ
jgi:cytidylate kinase